MKWILYIALVACSTYIGFCASNYSKKKKLIYQDLMMLCGFLENSISFSMDTIQVIISKHTDSFKSPINEVIVKYVLMLEQKSEITILNLTKNFKTNYLDKSELTEIVDFFYNLGRLGREEQIKQISAYKKMFEDKKEMYDEKVLKTSGLYTKIGFFIGLLLVIALV